MGFSILKMELYTKVTSFVQCLAEKSVTKDFHLLGKWRSNVKHGTAEEIYPNGDKFIGTYVEGRRQGR